MNVWDQSVHGWWQEGWKEGQRVQWMFGTGVHLEDEESDEKKAEKWDEYLGTELFVDEKEKDETRSVE